MANELIINATLPETRVAYLEDGEIQELVIERDTDKGIVGNIYKGKVLRVLPGMQAAFVDIGQEKAAFLYVDDVFFPDMENPLNTNPLPENLNLDDIGLDDGDDFVEGDDEVSRAVRAASNDLHKGRGRQNSRNFSKNEGRSGSGENSGENRGDGRNDSRGRNAGRNHRGGRDSRGGRNNQRFQRGNQPKPTIGVHVGGQGTSPDSPEEHAMLQRQYGMQMQDISEDEYFAELERKKQQQSQKTAEVQPKEEAKEVFAAQAKPDELKSSTPKARAYVDTKENDIDSNETDESSEDLHPEEWVHEVAAVQAHHDPDTEALVDDGSVVASAIESTTVDDEDESDEIADEVDIDEIEEMAHALVDEATDAAVTVETRETLQPGTSPQPAAQQRRPRRSDSTRPRRPRKGFVNIADLLKEGQEILVQVAKDPIATKGARLTCHVSLPGRYLVFMPTVDHVGVSRRIESDVERRRLKATIGAIRPAKTGVIVRTASGKQDDQKLKNDLDYLVETWNEIQKRFNRQKGGTVAYQDLSVPLRAVRDMVSDDIDRIIVDSKREYKNLSKFITKFMPHLKDKLVQHESDMPIFDYYGIETEIESALERRVWLKSGGYLMVDQAEALVAIDVNTGRYVGKKNLEETILKTNLEAVKEIAYQIRLRNCGGIIILDLIDMEKDSNKEKVYKALEEELKKDRARPTIMRISQLGLIEMTRKRTRDTIVRALCQACPSCKGRSYIKNAITVSYDVLRDIEREGFEKETTSITIQCNPEVADFLMGEKADVIANLEEEYGKKISIRSNGAYPLEQYEIGAQKGDGKSDVQSSDERKQKLKTKINQHMQGLNAERKRQLDLERDEKRRANQASRSQSALQNSDGTGGAEGSGVRTVARAQALPLVTEEQLTTMTSDEKRSKFFSMNPNKRIPQRMEHVSTNKVSSETANLNQSIATSDAPSEPVEKTRENFFRLAKKRFEGIDRPSRGARGDNRGDRENRPYRRDDRRDDRREERFDDSRNGRSGSESVDTVSNEVATPASDPSRNENSGNSIAADVQSTKLSRWDYIKQKIMNKGYDSDSNDATGKGSGGSGNSK